ncbi:hypothetical protein OH77DRAFT_515659 [Trametes cingulata]|nr:hypothetical protein OH77DRAFT_515659 [Trametes cingulata]
MNASQQSASLAVYRSRTTFKMSILGAALRNSPYALLVPVFPFRATVPKGHDPPHLTSSEAPTISHFASPTQRTQLVATSLPFRWAGSVLTPSTLTVSPAFLRVPNRRSPERRAHLCAASERGDKTRLESTQDASCLRSQDPVLFSVQFRSRRAMGTAHPVRVRTQVHMPSP